MITAGNLVFDPDVIGTLAPGMLNSIVYMFTWGTAYNIGSVLNGLGAAFGVS